MPPTPSRNIETPLLFEHLSDALTRPHDERVESSGRVVVDQLRRSPVPDERYGMPMHEHVT